MNKLFTTNINTNSLFVFNINYNVPTQPNKILQYIPQLFKVVIPGRLKRENKIIYRCY